jgi:LytS/YehU family sensor histidine kinase
MQYELNKKQEQMEAEAKEKEAEHLAETKRYKLIRNITIVGFFVILIIALLAIIVFRYRQKQKLVNLKNEIDKYRQRLMTQQINPHFIFNTLNSIQYFIYNNKKEESMEFVSQFAQLMRLNLYNSQRDTIALQDEIEALKLYLELERTRLEDLFDYSIEIDPAIDSKTQLVPSFLIQPLVENSIKHGVLNRKQKGNIQTRIIRKKDSLIYSVIDNGIGFERSKVSQKDPAHTSYGLELTNKRVSLIGLLNSKQTYFTFADIKNNKGVCTGAKVELVIPSSLRLV